jgi:hypothetical protein
MAVHIVTAYRSSECQHAAQHQRSFEGSNHSRPDRAVLKHLASEPTLRYLRLNDRFTRTDLHLVVISVEVDFQIGLRAVADIGCVTEGILIPELEERCIIAQCLSVGVRAACSWYRCVSCKLAHCLTRVGGAAATT